MDDSQNASALHPLLQRQLRRAGIEPGSEGSFSAVELQRLFADISDCYRNAEEDARRDNEQSRLQTLLMAMGDCVCTLNSQGCIVWGNPAAWHLLGFPPSGPIEESVAFYHQLQPLSGETAVPALEQQEHYRRALLRNRAGLLIPISYLENKIAPTEAHKESSVIVFRDITAEQARETALQEARESAKAASKAKSELLANVSHEVRTPLHGILGMAQLLLLDNNLNVAQTSYLRNLQSSAQGLLHILNDILDLSKIEAGRFSLEVIPFRPQAVLEEVRVTVESQAVAKELELRCRVDPSSPPCVVGDPTRIRQIVLNLVSNAIKFTDKGFVELSLRWTASETGFLSLLFEVSDSGIGIPPEKHGAIFEAFSQADSSITRRFGGTGLGLAICSRLAQMMNGHLTVSSKLGLGSTFGLSVPLPLAPENWQELAEQPAVHLPPLRILYAEDNTINQLTGRKILRAKGHTVQIVGTGRAAVLAVKQMKYDLILMDHQMPEMSGIEATIAIRRLGNTTPIIAASADAMQEDRERFLAAGMNGFVGKPFTQAELEREIARVLSAQSPQPSLSAF